MEPVTKEALEQGRKVRVKGAKVGLIPVQVAWLEGPEGRPVVALWWDKKSTPATCFPECLELVPEPERREMWMNVYPCIVSCHSTKDSADRAADENRQGAAVYIPMIRDGESWNVDVEKLKY